MYKIEVTSGSRCKIDTSNPTEVRISGIHTPPHTRVIFENDTLVVIAAPGYSYNPGSRFSGLVSYAPAETSAYIKGEDGWCYPVGTWDTRPKKSS